MSVQKSHSLVLKGHPMIKELNAAWLGILLQGILLFLAPGRVIEAANSKPNFVFITTDDQRFDALGVVQREQGEHARFPWFQTPNLDRLAAGGVRFKNAFVVSSLCSPSRAAYLTGRYNHLNGVANNRTPFPTNSVTFATLLREAGYETAYVGKWHMGNQSGQRPGFTYSASFVGQGQFFNCPFEINGQKTNTTGWVDDVSTDFALDFMARARTNPFCLALGYKAPHGPRNPPPRWTNRWADVQARPPVNAHARAPYLPSLTNPAPPYRTDEGLKNYFRCLGAIDENVGRILDALDRHGLSSNTVVIFASDNGYYLGEHGLGDKRTAYDESLRIPFLLRYPSKVRGGRVLEQMVLNIDLAPTLLELAGVAIPETMQGRSLGAMVEDRGVPSWRTEFLYEYFLESGLGPPSVIALRTERHKLIQYPVNNGWTELYDLASDPYETNNLIQGKFSFEPGAIGPQLKSGIETNRAPRTAGIALGLMGRLFKQKESVQFTVPEYADERAGGPPPATPRPQVRSLTPKLEGPWWQVATNPSLGPLGSTNQQPVDFSIWQAADGKWQLWSCVRNTREPGKTRLFHGWESETLTNSGWKPIGIAMQSAAARGETPGGLQAPHVFKHFDHYEMFYGDWENICRATSLDGKKFARTSLGKERPQLFGEGPETNTRDAMVLKVGWVYYCYYTAFPKREGAVYARASGDLLEWGPARIVNRGGKGGTGPFSAECPHVVQRSGNYFLFRTERYGKNNRTHVYRSAHPLEFGADGSDRNWIAELPVAAPEIIVDRGEEYLAALEPELNGIRISRLRWVEE